MINVNDFGIELMEIVVISLSEQHGHHQSVKYGYSLVLFFFGMNQCR